MNKELIYRGAQTSSSQFRGQSQRNFEIKKLSDQKRFRIIPMLSKLGNPRTFPDKPRARPTFFHPRAIKGGSEFPKTSLKRRPTKRSDQPFCRHRRRRRRLRMNRRNLEPLFVAVLLVVMAAALQTSTAAKVNHNLESKARTVRRVADNQLMEVSRSSSSVKKPFSNFLLFFVGLVCHCLALDGFD